VELGFEIGVVMRFDIVFPIHYFAASLHDEGREMAGNSGRSLRLWLSVLVIGPFLVRAIGFAASFRRDGRGWRALFAHCSQGANVFRSSDSRLHARERVALIAHVASRIGSLDFDGNTFWASSFCLQSAPCGARGCFGLPAAL